MNWDAIGAIGEVLGGLTIFVSIGVLILELRKNTKATRSAVYQAVGQGFSDMTWDLAKDPELMKILPIMWSDDYEIDLNEDQKLRLETAWRALFINQENLYLQYREGVIPQAYWLGKKATMQMHLRSSYSHAWWQENCWHFEPEFQVLVEQMIESNKGDA